jgi:hypothetical protein
VEKAAFLWKVMGALGLARVSLIHGDTQEGVSWLQGASHDSLDGRSRRIRRYLSRCGAIDPMDSILDIVDILPEGGPVSLPFWRNYLGTGRENVPRGTS